MQFEDFIQEGKKITLKRQYTENYPAITAGQNAKIRNRMLEAIGDDKITQEEFDAILKEYSRDSSRWMKRNSKYFNVSEDGISLSKFGKRAFGSIKINEEDPEKKGKSSKRKVNEATVELDAIDPKSKYLARLLKKNNVEMEILTMDGQAGVPEVKLTGKKKDLEKVLADPMGWDEPDLSVFIEESLIKEVNSAFGAARAKAIADGEDTFEFDGDTYVVDWSSNKENESTNESFIIESFSKFVESLNEKKVPKKGSAGYHQHKIAKDTVKNPNKSLLGGPSPEEAEETLINKFGYSKKEIDKLKK